MSLTNLEKTSHTNYSARYYRDNLTFKRIEQRAIAERKRDIYLSMANDAVVAGNLTHAEALRQVAMRTLPREWATLEKFY